MNENLSGEAQQTPPGVQLVITCDPQGHVNVTGPIENVVMCYGLLEMAKDAIRDFHAKKRQQRVAPVPFMPPSLVQP